ncbi:stearoyl-CoA 9-desaturase [Mycolicibacter minnesotensis]|uniref:Stearoyl-CoA 9-desaturase n=1 Tax=Mycolicibacter minnesotensis TaxID=1118379 RepID=A0A7I7R396_9MYCO|nr:ferredoxin reductase [Mycolicibacter minnesotensis]ORA98330.1 stearoyl-CoA 9-desaturase [Mycolicibacter minnesotensis]BBY32600.1 NADPH oxidoreductase [Mycolicibacter minnesotensis]
MSKKHSAIVAQIGDTRRPTAAGSDRHPGWNALRRIATQITTPLLPDDYLRLANPLWSARELRGRVVAVRRETEDSATLTIKPGWGFHFDYQAGQYIGIGLRVDGRWRWRSYSLTSAPLRGARTISITVKAMPEGFLSSHLVDGVAPGTVVRLAAPQGEFVLPEPPPAALLFVTAGSGITPIMAMLRSLARRGAIADVVHLHSAPTAADALFADELAALARAHPGYRLLLRTTRDQGRLELRGPEVLDGEVPDWRVRQTWACGPAALLADAERAWAAAGIADHLHVERFAVARTAVAEGGGTVTFAASGKSVAADAATTLLEAGENAGVSMPFGCRMGICQSCVVMLVAGQVRDLRTGADHEPGTRVQTCVSAAAGDCELDA